MNGGWQGWKWHGAAERAAMARDAEAFTARIDKLAAHVRASGDFADPPNASPAERYVRASLRGADAMAGGILGAALEA
ncbi:MAG: hypothetical protein Q8O82_04840 [Pseudorhodobacter sp.]|nr:hypothetical protein [Pseudorhodobacter sp.]